MNKVHYKKIMLEGFQSYESRTIFNLDRVGMNLIKGTNGKGKSTLFNAVLWCEYGINLKKSIETWESNRTRDYKGTRVILERTDGKFDYRIVRHKNYKGTTLGITGGSKLMILKKPVEEPKFSDKHLVGDGLHKKDMQDIIQQQIGLDSQTFLSSIMFGQRTKSLVEAPNNEKRKLFEELFALDFIDLAREKAKEDLSSKEAQQNKLENEAEKAENIISQTEKTIEEHNRIIKDFKTKKEKRVSKVVEKIKEIEAKMKALKTDKDKTTKEIKKYDEGKLKGKKDQLSNMENRLKNLTEELQNIDKTIRDHKQELTKSETNIKEYKEELKNIESDCPYCEQELPKSKIKTVEESIKSKIKTEQKVKDELSKKLNSNEADKDKTVESLNKHKKYTQDKRDLVSEMENDFEGLTELRTKLTTLVSDERHYNSNLKTLKKELKEEEEDKPPKIDSEKYQKLIKDNTKILTESESKIEDIADELQLIDWWIKKGFGSGGMKAFVFNAMLNQLNKYAQKYADRLGFRVEFSVDMSKASKPFRTMIYKGQEIRDYEDLSGGQKQRVDVCIAFAMHDLIAHKSDINILVMDEITEGLDNRGIEAFFDLSRQKAENKSVYLVTHSDIIDSLNCNIVNIEADENGNSYIE